MVFSRKTPAAPAQEERPLLYLDQLLRTARPVLEKYGGGEYGEIIREVENARKQKEWDDLWGAEHAADYACQALHRIFWSASRKLLTQKDYRIPEEEYQILCAVYEELHAFRRNCQEALYRTRFTYDRRYHP